MKRRHFFLGLSASFLTAPAHADSMLLRRLFQPAARRPLLIAGSSAMAELTTALAAGFAKAYPDIDVVTEVGSSLSAFIALKRGSIDVAAMSRDLRDDEDEKGIRNYLVARTAIDIVVQGNAAVTTLSSQQVRGILRGEIDNWAQVGQSAAPIQVIAGALSRDLLEEEILQGRKIPDTSKVFRTPLEAAKAVEGDPHAIGFVIHTETWNVEDRRLAVDGVDVSRATLLSNRYPFTKSLYFAVKNEDPQAPCSLFADFVRGRAGQQIINALDLIATG